jgi:hypothetical protein
MSQLKPLRHRTTPRQQRRRQLRSGLRQLRAMADGHRTFGLLTVQKHLVERWHGRHWHVSLDGVDVTTRCFVADDRQGYVGLFQVNEQGVKIVHRGEVGWELCTGDVRIAPGAPVVPLR